MKKNRVDVVVKDQFRNVTFHNGDESILCLECFEKLCPPFTYKPKNVLVALTTGEYEEVQCEQCSAVSPMTAYYDEIEVLGSIEEDKTARAIRFNERRNV